MMPSEWHDWHDFYMLLGTASAALVALLFVAVSIGASFLTPERSVATRTFMSPVVFHFSTLLLISLIVMVPTHTALSLAIGIALVAVAGLGYTTCPCLDQRYRRPVRLRDFTARVLCGRARRRGCCRFAREACCRHLGRRTTHSSCGQHSQCLGSDAGFCPPDRQQEHGYLSAPGAPNCATSAFRDNALARLSIEKFALENFA